MRKITTAVALLIMSATMSACSPQEMLTLSGMSKANEAMQAWEDLGTEGQDMLCEQRPKFELC